MSHLQILMMLGQAAEALFYTAGSLLAASLAWWIYCDTCRRELRETQERSHE